MRKGYQSVKLAASKVGSAKAKEIKAPTGNTLNAHHNTQHADASLSLSLTHYIDTKAKEQSNHESKSYSSHTSISEEVKKLVKEIYEEATNLLTSKIAAQITAEGIESPLGILDEEQIAKGEAILSRLEQQLGGRTNVDSNKLSGEVSNIFFLLLFIVQNLKLPFFSSIHLSLIILATRKKNCKDRHLTRMRRLRKKENYCSSCGMC